MNNRRLLRGVYLQHSGRTHLGQQRVCLQWRSVRIARQATGAADVEQNDRQYTYNVTQRRVRVTIVAVEQQ